MSKSQPKELNPNWKGGIRFIDGYAFVLMPEHPRAMKNGYVMRAIANWEKANGKPFPEGMEPHHKNLLRFDDRSINIQPLTHAEHKRLHSRLHINEAEIRRLYFTKHLTVKAIASRLKVSFRTVMRCRDAAA